jgi:hypothetical protein
MGILDLEMSHEARGDARPADETRRKLRNGSLASRQGTGTLRAILVARCIAAILALSIGGGAEAAGRNRQPELPLPPMKPPILFHAPERTPGVPDPLDNYDALSYQISIRVNPPPLGDGTLTGTVEMSGKAINDLISVDLDIGATLSADSAWTGSQLCPFTRPSTERVRIQLPATVTTGDSFDVKIRYSGDPGPMCFPGMTFYGVHGSDDFPVVSTLAEPDCSHQWWPCKDRLDDKATVELTVDAPAGFVTAGNGNLVSEETVGDRSVTKWRESYPITPYLVAFASSNYTRWTDTYHTADGDSIPLMFYAFPEDEDSARVHYRVMPQALKAYEPDSIYGPYPYRNPEIAREKLGVVEFPWSGAEEHQTIVSEGSLFVRHPYSSATVLAHEISHQWWGDAVTCKSVDDMWLNEGFASYSEALYSAARDTVDHARGYRGYMMQLRNPIGFEYPGSCVRPVQTFGSTTYRKGAWVLHMLRGVLGRDLFYQCLHEYYARYQYGNASTEEFTRAVEETAARDLRWFFVPWLYGVGRPQLAWDWQDTSPGSVGYRLRLHVTQTQPSIDYPTGAPVDDPPSAYSFPLDVRIFGAAQDSLTRRIFVDGPDAIASLDSLPFQPTRVALDPDNWILADPRVQRGNGSVTYLGEIAPTAPPIATNQVRIWPNPSSSGFTILLRAGAGRTTIAVYDAAGRRIRTLPTISDPGDQEIIWDGTDDAGRRAASGLYLIRISGPGGTRSSRAIAFR